jgi:hypothetical protein
MLTPDEWRVVGIGFLGSVAVEVANVVRTLEAGKHLAARYRRPTFLIVRLLLAFISGAVALLYKPSSDLLAFHLGAATPAILQMLSTSQPALGETPPAPPVPPPPPAPKKASKKR